ncbi:MAG: DNA-binding protein WhiA [Clostridia bacterium]|nr:DNA-binding protein WhiA [Clostridia bacterium]
MSFSSELKEELSKINNLNKKEEVKFELLGYLISKNTTCDKNNIRYATESDYNINRFSKLLKNLDINHNIEFDGKSFIITFKLKDKLEEIDLKNNQIVIKQINNINENYRRALIRGAFLGSGSINNPDKTHHLEINLSNKNNMDKLFIILKESNIKSKKFEQENKYSIYFKDGEVISIFIALIGANNSVLKFEDIRVQKEMRGKVNRIVNCQTANLNKTLNASVEQIDAIRKLQVTGKFNKLDDNLKEIALLRLEYPDMSLIELGKKLKKPIGKSGVNYRLKKIMQIADERN